MDVEKLKAAAKAAYPELWPEDEAAATAIPGATGKARLTYLRQDAMDRVGRALEAYENFAGEEIKPLGDLAVGLPEDAAMIQQVLITIAYIDQKGQTCYVVRTSGDGLRTTWLGMCVLAQDYLMKLPGLYRDE